MLSSEVKYLLSIIHYTQLSDFHKKNNILKNYIDLILNEHQLNSASTVDCVESEKIGITFNKQASVQSNNRVCIKRHTGILCMH